MSDAHAPLTLGTAGHIDHGKTALIRALTGKDTDRLPEEHARGISIELGYAPLELPGGRRLSVVDVPGHERFVRTMVAGASGVDMFLLCVAADDGVMPQTREHMAVLRGLGVRDGVVAITKSDVAEPEPAAAEAAELVPGAPVVPVSAHRRTGLGELLAALEAVAARVPSRARADSGVRLHVDRSFTLRGIGTIVTGTLWSGAIGAGDRVAVLPRGIEARVRSVQVHDRPAERAAAGQRVALNLAGPSWRELGRGDVVVGAGSTIEPTYRVEARLDAPVERGTRVQVHHGTRDAPARAYPREDGVTQLRLEAPLVASEGDRLVLRRIAPPDTVGGGVVVDAHPPRTGRRKAEGGRRKAEVLEPESPPPLDDAALRLAALLRSDWREPRAHGDLADAVGLSPSETERRLSQLERSGQAVRVAKNLHFHPEPLAELEAQVIALCERDGAATIAALRDELGTSRRYAQAVLEHLDRTKVTRRDGDAHVLRRRLR
jgi:selenocysteine-specific elongation factor